MVYLVQMIKAGAVVQPWVYVDPTSAQQAFLVLVQEHAAADFSQYCALHGADGESFAAAQAFAATAGGKDASFFYRPLALEGEGEAAKPLQLPLTSRKPALSALTETQKQVLGVQADLRALTEKLTGMSQELIRLQSLLGDGGEGEAAKPTEVPELIKPKADALEEKYQTAEWQDFIQSLIGMCGGNRGEFPLLSRQDWRQAVYDNHTMLQYWEWVAFTIDQAIERAKTRGYTIEEDGAQSGHFAYLTPTGERSATVYEMEDLAWCAAGLDAARRDRAQG